MRKREVTQYIYKHNERGVTLNLHGGGCHNTLTHTEGYTGSKNVRVRREVLIHLHTLR